MSLDNWKLENDLCRCCHAEGIFKNLGVRFYNELGEEEIYSDMIRDNLGIDLTPVEGLLCEVTFKICDQCVLRLRDVTCFKRQVQSCEEKFRDMYSRNVFKVVEPFSGEIKVEPEIDVMKIEENADDGFDARFSDEEDDKALIEQKIKNEELRKTRSKGKTKAKAKPKEHVKKERVAKQKKNCQVKKKESVAEDGNVPVKKKGQRAAKFRLNEEDYMADGNEYVCRQCEKRYDKMCSLKFHIKTKHYKIPRFVCSFCQKEFMTPAPLTIHKLEVHNVDERHKCNACKGTFNTKVQLRKHINNFHMLGEKYKCDFCDYESFSFEGMYKHKFKHKTVKDFHCRFCRKSFLRKTTLDLHERIHTGDRRKVCKVCGQAFVQKASLNYHMSKYHPEVNF